MMTIERPESLDSNDIKYPIVNNYLVDQFHENLMTDCQKNTIHAAAMFDRDREDQSATGIFTSRVDQPMSVE